MVWRPDQLGAFLDTAENERLYALFCVVAYCALRRGEAVGQKLAEVDYEAGALMIGPTIVQVGGKAVAKEDAKTDGSETWVRAGPEVMEPLRALRQRQIAEKLRWGPAWNDTGYVHTLQDGNPYDPGYVSNRFERVAFMAGLPPVSLRDVRHCAPTLPVSLRSPTCGRRPTHRGGRTSNPRSGYEPPIGIEPMTYALRVRRSNRLS